MAKVYFSPNSQKLFNKIKDKKTKNKIKAGISKLTINPYAGKKLEGEFEGQYSIRTWPYRIVYYISKDKNVIITDIGHRKEIYR
ncbi:MAG: type II toxin-antitoxin system RelE/ParE family toxin [Patescibacteria group bacterium]